MYEFIHGVFIECTRGAYVLVWILELMENGVKGTEVSEEGPEKWPEQDSGVREKWCVEKLGVGLKDK